MLAGPDLWKRMALKCYTTMVLTSPFDSWCKMSSAFRENNIVVVFPFPFYIFMPLPNLWFIRLQGYVVSHPKDKKLSWSLAAHPPSGKAVGTRYRVNPYPGINSVPSYVSRLWCCPLSPARMCRYRFSLHWGSDPKAFLIPLWYLKSVHVIIKWIGVCVGRFI